MKYTMDVLEIERESDIDLAKQMGYTIHLKSQNVMAKIRLAKRRRRWQR